MIPYAQAHGHVVAATSFVDKLNSNIIFPLLSFLLALAVLVFVWGGFQYLYKAEDSSARAEGQKHMLYGIIGIVVMVTAFALLAMVTRTLFGDAVIPAP